MRDLTDASPAAIAAERARVPREGIGVEILTRQGSDGSWHRADAPAWLPTLYTLLLLRTTGVDCAEPAVESVVARLEKGFRWDEEFGEKPFFEGEVEPCINGGTLALGAYFGRPTESLALRLVGEQLDDGGWNCEAPKSARSSFHTTICVLEGLLEYERAGGSAPEIGAARSICSSVASSGGAPPARSRHRRSWSSLSLPATITTFSVRSTTSGTPVSGPTRASAMPCTLSRASGRPTVDGFSIAPTTRRWPSRSANL